MEDMTAKIQEILSDKESMQQLNELAQMFASSENSGDQPKETQKTEKSDQNGMLDFDFSMIFKLQDIMSKTADDKTSGFLLALKPLLKEEKQQKVDKAVKILRIFAVWEILKDSGLLNDFLQ